MKTNYTHKTLLLLLICTLCFYGRSKAQVTVGSNTPVESYETLRIDGNNNKGLRLSRLTQTERENLTNTTITISAEKKELAKGLVIYNINHSRIEFWDGDQWRALNYTLTFLNGLNLFQPGEARLGGNLSEKTVIDQKNQNFKITTREGVFSINTDALHVDSLNIMSSNIDQFRVDTILNVYNKNNVDIRTGKSGFIVNNTALKIINDSVRVNGHFQYKDGNETLAVPGTDIILKAKDNNGKANWEILTPTVLNSPFTINRASGSPNGPSGTVFATDTWTTITDLQTIPKGKWLIFGRFVTYSSLKTDASSGSEANYMSSLRLVRQGTSSDEVLYSSMTLPERKSTSGDENSGSYSVPQLVYFLDAADDATYRIDFKTKKGSTWRSTVSWLGDQYFYAIKLND